MTDQTSNLLLRALSPASYESVKAKLSPVDMPRKAMVVEADAAYEFVYFPDEGVISGVVTTQDGQMIEIATIGRDGFVGIPLVLGVNHSARKMFSQIPGKGNRMEVTDFQHELTINMELKTLCNQYAVVTMNQMAQSAACNRLHSIEERCARWLLAAHDRSGKPTVELTQEFLSEMLGVGRPGVNIALRTLQKAGLIESSRASIVIVDRMGLEAVSCECYKIVTDLFAKTMGFEIRSAEPQNV